TLAEKIGAVDGQGTGRETVERVIAIDDLLATGRTAGKFDRPFDRLRAAVAEEHPRQAAADVLGQLFGNQSRQSAAAHPDEVGQVLVEQLLEGGLDLRMVASDREDPPSGEQVEILVALVIPEVRPFSPNVA